MYRAWFVLLVIVFAYVPVAIDATVLHVAAPTLSVALGASGSELLWIIDIYSLVMAGMVLPMGALGDRLGFKRLLILGAMLFGAASVGAALAPDAAMLIAARALLGVGASMILPATLAGIRNTFGNGHERNVALGIWAAVGAGGAAFGPLVGGILLAHFSWNMVFLINLPMVALVLLLAWRGVPKQAGNACQRLNFSHSLMLVVAVLALVWSIKYAIQPGSEWLTVLMMLASGLFLLLLFVRLQRRSMSPLLDIELLTHRTILTGAVMALISMVALVGFELLMAQELQFVQGKTPLQAGMFMLPIMLASSLCGPFAGLLVARFGLRQVAAAGVALSAIGFYGLAHTDFARQPWLAWGWMTLLGLSVATALLSGTSAIMSAVPQKKAAAAGAIETMAYELGAGLGVAFAGLLLTRSYRAAIDLPQGLSSGAAQRAGSSVGEAAQVALSLDSEQATRVMSAAAQAFSHSHSVVLGLASLLMSSLALIVWFTLKNANPVSE
jgi:DHA2 family multidrug resistance protein-like MFS transporter